MCLMVVYHELNTIGISPYAYNCKFVTFLTLAKCLQETIKNFFILIILSYIIM